MPHIQPAISAAHREILILWQRVNTSLSAFYKLQKSFKTASEALKADDNQWQELGIHAKHLARKRIATDQQDEAFIHQLEQRIAAKEFSIVFKGESNYPEQLNQLFDPPPLLFYRGDVSRLQMAQIAIVGSRKPTTLAQKFTFDMAQYLAQAGYIITSGLAQGVDAQAHLGALALPVAQSGRTVGVMGTGIDVCYPAPHRALFDRIVAEGGCIISELLPGIQPNKHTFPRRNRIVSGLSLGTVVTEARIQSGSLITARLTSEQGKQVFALPSNIDNINAEGCHHLIREGATLIYHPDQVIQDLASQIMPPNVKSPQPDQASLLSASVDEQMTNQPNRDESNPIAASSNETVFIEPNKQHVKKTQDKDKQVSALKPKTTANIPKHLQNLWVHIEFSGQDLDVLIHKTQLTAPALLSQLMELELMGVVEQSGGRYKRI